MKKKLRKEFNKIKEKGYKIVDIRQNPFNPTNGNKGRYFEFHVYVEKQSTKEQLLEKAKRDYVKRTIYQAIGSDNVYTSTGIFIQENNAILDSRQCHLYKNGKWAKIISKPLIKVQSKWLYEGDEWYQIQKHSNWVLMKFKVHSSEITGVEESKVYKRFLTKQSALDYVLEETEEKFKGVSKVAFSLSTDTINSKNLHLSTSSSGMYRISEDNYNLWNEKEGWIAEPIKEEVPEWVVCLGVNDLYKNELFVNKVYKVDEYNSNQGQYWVKCDLDGEVYGYSEKRFRTATKPEIDAHKLGFHIGDEVYDNGEKSIDKFKIDRIFDNLGLCVSGGVYNSISINRLTKESPNKLMLGKHEVEIDDIKVPIDITNTKPGYPYTFKTVIGCNGGQVTKEDWIKWQKVFVPVVNFGGHVNLKLGEYEAYNTLTRGIVICDIKNVTIAQIEAITNRINDL